jgi:hypothetical protein
LFAFHELPDALQRLTPPWESSNVIQASRDLKVGSRAIIETRIFGLFPVRWVAEHTAYDPPHMFEDVQIEDLSGVGVIATSSSQTRRAQFYATRSNMKRHSLSSDN